MQRLSSTLGNNNERQESRRSIGGTYYYSHPDFGSGTDCLCHYSLAEVIDCDDV